MMVEIRVKGNRIGEGRSGEEVRTDVIRKDTRACDVDKDRG